MQFYLKIHLFFFVHSHQQVDRLGDRHSPSQQHAPFPLTLIYPGDN